MFTSTETVIALIAIIIIATMAGVTFAIVSVVAFVVTAVAYERLPSSLIVLIASGIFALPALA